MLILLNFENFSQDHRLTGVSSADETSQMRDVPILHDTYSRGLTFEKFDCARQSDCSGTQLKQETVKFEEEKLEILKCQLAAKCSV